MKYMINSNNTAQKVHRQSQKQPRKHLLGILVCVLIAFGYALPAASEPKRAGVIREANPGANWVTIDSRRLVIVPQTVIKNLAVGGNSPRALQKGRQVRYSANDRHELLEIWIYPEKTPRRGKANGLDIELRP